METARQVSCAMKNVTCRSQSSMRVRAALTRRRGMHRRQSMYSTASIHAPNRYVCVASNMGCSVLDLPASDYL